MKGITVMICDAAEAVYTCLERQFSEENIDTVWACDGEAALKTLESRRIDLVVLDVLLPGMDRTQLLQQLRGDDPVPFIILSAKAGELDRIMGLKLGAEDYIAKPFSAEEVVLRARAVLRRVRRQDGERCIRIAELSVYPESFKAELNGKRVNLTPSDFKLLSYLAQNEGKVLSREQILNAVWGYEYYGSSRAVDTQIKRLRQCLLQGDVHFAIQSVYGVGYKLETVS